VFKIPDHQNDFENLSTAARETEILVRGEIKALARVLQFCSGGAALFGGCAHPSAALTEAYREPADFS